MLNRMIVSLQRSVRTYAIFSDAGAKQQHDKCAAELEALVSAVAVATNKHQGDPACAAIQAAL